MRTYTHGAGRSSRLHSTVYDIFDKRRSDCFDNLVAQSSSSDSAFDEFMSDKAQTVQDVHFVPLPTVRRPDPNKALDLIGFSRSAASLLNLDPSEKSTSDFLKTFSGADTTSSIPANPPFASVYGCHCGDQYFGQLGDGRAVTILETDSSNNGQRYEVQLKGSTTTPFSRGFDGRAALRGCIRELLGSEGLASLGVPTQRVLSVIGTNDFIDRPWYRDDPTSSSSTTTSKFPPNKMISERAAVLTRFASSFLRFGHFEIHFMREEHELLKKLIIHSFKVEFPHLLSSTPPLDFDEQIKRFVNEVVDRQAKLVAEWLRVGYTQGNMNSDNTAIGGYTLDLGPFAFMEKYDRHFQPFTSDTMGRFSFTAQPSAVLLALQIWTTAVVSACDDEEIAGAVLGDVPKM
ncbi:hypothetical protein TL16_g07596 [Triparma laevis f. inornata]|uniref:Selenoprotein O n=2 Tax=Triparma laevis TaxID=1534972 RepID=A0A9W7EBS4_9STRA|nr:hypothetical protein TrLO_g11149 [Triparma laevis f. longispina]GMH77948.1 hypothetical protein TL16_g07596 [Triparma laevis f. inornata]